ncbi:MAG TPA: class I SAM-dependent methyltransferase [Acidobacteriota bacterium]|nr:class I SAM-dependent methyltransferase [Acidobacteriota bacterium]
MGSFNFYEDPHYADAYSKLEFPGTYYLAYRDLPEILALYVTGTKAIDFGCGAGRSTRFLRKLGFDVTGIDISEEMIQKAQTLDPPGDYRLITDGDFSRLEAQGYDLVLSAFTFDNVPTMETKVRLFTGIRGLLLPHGKMINLVSAPEIYLHEWASFSTRKYSENRAAKSGDEVRIINTAIADERPVVDILMTDEAYRDVYAKAGMEIVSVRKPLGRADEPFAWVNETTIAPWVIYVLQNPAHS